MIIACHFILDFHQLSIHYEPVPSNKLGFVSIKDSDQTAHVGSLIRVFG